MPGRPPRRSRRRRASSIRRRTCCRVHSRRARARLRRAWCAGRARAPTACPSCTSSRRRSAVLQGKGFRVALVTDGRMSGASGKVPAAIHVSPEALAGGPLGKVRDGDVVRLDAHAGHAATRWCRRRRMGARASRAACRDAQREANGHGLGRELFAGMRAQCRCGRGRSLHMAVTTSRDGSIRCELAMHDAPVIPVIVLERRDACGAAGARAGRRRHPHARGDVAHAGGAALHRGDRAARCPRPSSAPAPCAAPPTRRPRRRPGARFGVSPGYTRAVGRGLPRPRPAAAARRGDRQRVMAAQDDGYTRSSSSRRVPAGGVGDAQGAGTARSPTSRSARPAASPPRPRREFLALPNVACVGGSWLTPADAIAAADWARITALARRTRARLSPP